MTGAADDDPAGVAPYTQAGGAYGNAQLWAVPVALPMMVAVREMCDRMALAAGDSLRKLIRRRFGRVAQTVIGVLLAALIVASVLNLSADLMAIGPGMRLLGAGPAPLWSAIAGAEIAIALEAGSFRWIGRIFKWLCLALLVYIGVPFVTHVDWASVLRGVLRTQFRLEPAYPLLLWRCSARRLAPTCS